jgi:hypothetical protein
MHGHLATLETDLVEAAGTGLLAFVAATTGLAQAGADATADALAGVLAARSGLDGVQLHVKPPRT